jgi:hypothetical protein
MSEVNTTNAPAQADDTVGNANGGKGRKAPSQSGKAKLRWADGILATVKDGDKVLATFHIQKDGAKFKGVVKQDGKTETLISGVSKERAYYALTHFYHYGVRPEVKVAKAPAKKAATKASKASSAA